LPCPRKRCRARDPILFNIGLSDSGYGQEETMTLGRNPHRARAPRRRVVIEAIENRQMLSGAFPHADEVAMAYDVAFRYQNALSSAAEVDGVQALA
jgi:hypothetical protein